MTVPLEIEFADFRKQLILGGMLHQTSATDIWTIEFERIVSAVSRTFGTRIVPGAIQTFRFAPTLPRSIVERTGYPAMFPHLVGFISHPLAAESEPPSMDLGMPGAACHPVFAARAGSRVEIVCALWAEGYVFRHEPSPDPMRMMSFRQTEAVFIGGEDEVRESVEDALVRCADMLADWHIQTDCVEASDSFVGPLATLRKQLQLEAGSKRELLHGVWAHGDSRTALASGNLHGTRFGDMFDIRRLDDLAANSGCVGLGLERTALALLRIHGMDPSRWPTHIRDTMAASC